MKALFRVFLPAALAVLSSQAQVPDNLVAEGIPPFPPALKASVARYMEFRGAIFNNWHPLRREMLVTTRIADATQLHRVKMPGGARRQLTFSPDPVAGGMFRPKTGEFIVLVQDSGGGEFYQLYRLDPADGKITLLTDGKSRHDSPKWSRSGKLLAYTSTEEALSSPSPPAEGGEGRGEEGRVLIDIPSPRPSPHSSVVGKRELVALVVSGCASRSFMNWSWQCWPRQMRRQIHRASPGAA